MDLNNSMETQDSKEHSQEEESESTVSVFQCLKCRRIVADSTAWLTAIPTLSIVTFYELLETAVTLHESLHMSKDGTDKGCVFSHISCGGCNQAIGRVYRSTFKEFDIIRDRYSLNAEAVEIYNIDLSRANKWKSADADTSLISKMNIDLGLVQGKVESLSGRMDKVEKTISCMSWSKGSKKNYVEGEVSDSENICPKVTSSRLKRLKTRVLESDGD